MPINHSRHHRTFFSFFIWEKITTMKNGDKQNQSSMELCIIYYHFCPLYFSVTYRTNLWSISRLIVKALYSSSILPRAVINFCLLSVNCSSKLSTKLVSGLQKSLIASTTEMNRRDTHKRNYINHVNSWSTVSARKTTNTNRLEKHRQTPWTDNGHRQTHTH